MAIILVTGGTGALGREIVARLAAGRHRTRILRHSRRGHPADPPGVEMVSGDLVSGAGIRDAVAAADVIIHAATSFADPVGVDVEGTRRLLEAAGEVAAAGVRLQSIDSGEVAGRLVALAEMGPLGHIAAMGGPEILTIEEMTTAYLQACERAATVRSEPLSDALYDALRSGDQLTPDHAYGLLTWNDFLRRTSLSVPRSS